MARFSFWFIMMNRNILFLALFFLSVVSFAQPGEQPKELTKTEKQIALLQELGKRMILEDDFEARRDANYAFIKQLTRLLKQKDSYEISLKDLSFMSVQKPEDNAFRIMTWQMETAPGLFRHYGAIQKNTKDLELIPLTDRSDDMQYPELYVGDNKHWFGAIYYKVQSVKTKKGTKYYLYGYDSHNPISNKKLIEVMEFTDDKTVMFGNSVFPDILREGKQATRFILEYREDASVRLNYSPELKKIVFDHLVPINEASEGIFADYVPDGTFDALVMKNGLFYLQRDVVATSTEPLENQNERPKSNTLYKSKAKE